MAERFRGTPGHYFEQGFDVQLRPQKFVEPLRWRRGRRIFVNSMSDLFHDEIGDDFIATVWAVMALAPQHTFQVLTKRHARMRALLRSNTFHTKVFDSARGLLSDPVFAVATARPVRAAVGRAAVLRWPLPHVWLGVSAEDQRWAEIRLPALFDTPAARRFVSCEPLLGFVDLVAALSKWRQQQPRGGDDARVLGDVLHWVIVGGESGVGARPMHPGWVRGLRDQAGAEGIAFLFKQWGEWSPETGHRYSDFHQFDTDPGSFVMRVGKRAAGRELDGRMWDEFPTDAEVGALW